ncbi:MAG: ABC transporter permease [Burkholderiales bacterium]|jgi:ABC-2 type transport system permease protein|nr:ABC transporter permease [Burkholderiales bacterium]
MQNERAQGWRALLYKEVLRFCHVGTQTIAAPVLTALLYLLIFSHVLESRVLVFGGQIAYTTFLVPGLIMMSVLQNAFANTSSSLIQSRIVGNMVFFLLAPITPWGFFAAYTLAGVLRGVMVGVGVWLAATLLFTPALWQPVAPLWSLIFLFLGSALLAMLGIIAGLWSEKFDHLATFQNFIIVPMTFLSGVFYSVQTLPDFWIKVSHLNPFFYMIDGFRYGFFGIADVSPWISLMVVGVATLFTTWTTWRLIASGWKLRP